MQLLSEKNLRIKKPYLMGLERGEERSDLPFYSPRLALPGWGIKTRKQFSLRRELLYKGVQTCLK